MMLMTLQIMVLVRYRNLRDGHLSPGFFLKVPIAKVYLDLVLLRKIDWVAI